MRKRVALTLWLICSSATAKDMSGLYTDEKLKADAAQFGDQIRAEYDETLVPKLTDEERTALTAIKIDFPLKGNNGDPFEFYYRDGTIYLPAFSLRFYSDLCVANAWLNAHGYDGTTVRDYVALLFRDAAKAISAHPRLPPVFATLGIPDNAREETRVSARASQNFANTVVFLLAHEIGHALKKHHLEGRDAQQQRTQEIEADQFAIELLRRIGQVPLGIEFWFDVERYRVRLRTEAIPTKEEWQEVLDKMDHPVTTERMSALADEIDRDPGSFARLQDNKPLWISRVKMMAQAFRTAAPFAGDRIARAAEYSRVRELRLDDVKPRKSGFIVPGSTEHDEDFNGLFAVRRTTTDGGQDVVDLLLLRLGEEITGGYSSKTVEGMIDGKIVNGALHFNWREGKLKGRGMVENGGETIRGTWGRDEAEAGGGELIGVRVRKKKEPDAR